MQFRSPLGERLPQRKRSQYDMDRFIPFTSAMNMDFAKFMLTGGSNGNEDQSAYQQQLAELFDMNRPRIFSFKNKPPAPEEPFPKHIFPPPSVHHSRTVRSRRYIPQNSERTLDAPGIIDDFYLNILDWGSKNILAIALGDTVHLWNALNGHASELVTVDSEDGHVTSVRWAPDDHHLAIGLNNSEVQLWDCTVNAKLRTLRGGHQLGVNSLAWNDQILSTGGQDTKIINNDVRVREHIIETYRGHRQGVCGLNWSASGRQLASGGNDDLVFIWDSTNASSSSARQWLHRLNNHSAAVKALAWCPFQDNMLASGGGDGDGCIKFWNTITGSCLNSVDTGSQVSALLWNTHERELLSSHGFSQNQLTLWKYPSMKRMAELKGHTSRVLYMAQSPDGYTVASAAGDEKLKLWNVFGTPKVSKPKQRANPGPFTHISQIR